MQKLKAKLRANNYRYSKILAAILQIFQEANKPLEVQEINQRLLKKNLKPNKTTLYRQMDKLLKLELVQETIFSDAISRYCLTPSAGHHHHFYCLDCGYSEDLPQDICEQITAIEETFLKRNFKINKHQLEIEGYCQNCSNC
jgi:Fe2+ or Zn2+ uptake regulation protein